MGRTTAAKGISGTRRHPQPIVYPVTVSREQPSAPEASRQAGGSISLVCRLVLILTNRHNDENIR